MPLPVSGVSIGLFGLLYVILLITLGVMSIRTGSTGSCSSLGILIQLFWIIGALMPPTQAATR